MKNYILRKMTMGLIFTVVFFGSILKLKSQTNTWIGGIGNWDVANNWSLGHIPTNLDTVVIGSGYDVTIPSSYSAIAIVIKLEGILRNNGNLAIANHSDSAINVSGEFINSGTITSVGFISVLITVKGQGVFRNENGSQINGNAKFFNAIELKDSSIFYNYGSIRALDECSNIIHVDEKGSFYNYGFIQNTDTLNYNGIYLDSSGYFENAVNGNITIKRTRFDGLFIYNALSKFVNNGILNLNERIGRDGIRSHPGQFYNGSAGIVDIDDFNDCGLNIYQGRFDNYGQIKIGSGWISIYVNTFPVFTNHKCGELIMSGRIHDLGSNIVNEGILIQKFNGINYLDNVYPFQNKGVIQDDFGSFSQYALTSDGIYISKYLSTVQEGNPIQDIIEGDGIGWMIIGNQFYVDRNLTIGAGSYSPINNTWLPNGAAAGLDTFYFEVSDGSGCSNVLYISLQNPVKINCSSIYFTGQIGDWDVPNNWDIGRLPTSCDTVYIEAGSEVTIPPTFSAESNHVHVEGKLINKGMLTFSDSSYISSTMEVAGEVKNEGTIIFSKDDFDGIKVRSTGQFINELNSQINFNSSGSTSSAIRLLDTSQFINYGSLEANNNYNYLFFLSDLANVKNYGLIKQTSPGKYDGGAIITSNALFENKLGGFIEFGQIELWDPQTRMINSGDLYATIIKIDAGTFNNLNHSQIDQAQIFTTKVDINGIFSNEGRVFIKSNPNLINTAPELYFNYQAFNFQNSLCGIIEIDGLISIPFASNITNDGIIIQDFNGSNIVNSLANFNNNGIIVDIYDSFKNLYNIIPGYSLRKITRPVTRGIPLELAILGNGSGLSITSNQFYVDENRTLSAGIFSTTNNTWTPNLAAIGRDTFYMEITNSNCAVNGFIALSEPVNIDCGKITFTASSGTWDNPNNWDKGRIPTSCDTVYIPMNVSITIPSGFNAESASIINDGFFTLDAGSNLNLSDTSQLNLIFNNGTISNSGSINLSNGQVGIYNTINSDLRNHNLIKIINIQSCGLRCEGIVTNSGNIELSGGDYGIIGNANNSFSNYGNLKINNVNYNGLNLSNGYFFRNESLGTTEVSGINSTGIEIAGNQTSFINNGDLEIDSTGYVGLLLSDQSSFKNYSGSVSIFRTNNSGILIDNTNTIFENESYILVDPNDQRIALHMIDTSHFINKACGTLVVKDGIFMYNSTFENKGLLRQSEVTSSNSWTGTFLNSGIVEDPEDNFAGLTITNTGYLIGLLSGTFTENIPVPNVLKGTGNQLTVINNLFYTDNLASNSAGFFNPSQNTWTPNSNAVGASKFYIVIDNNSSCKDTIEIHLSSQVQPTCIGFSNSWVGAQIGDWDDVANWDQGHIPLTCEDIIIPSGAVVTIPTGVYAVGRSILVEGELVINERLSLGGAIERPGMDIFRGDVKIFGSLYIQNVQGGNGNCHGIRAYGPGAEFYINYGGDVNINMVSDHGMLQESGSRIDINGSISISNSGNDEIFTDLGGEIDGYGVISLNGGNWKNAGETGHSLFINDLTIMGNFTATSTSLINLQLNSADGGGFIENNDYFEIQGDLTLSGDLQLLLIDGYIPTEGEVYEIFKYTGTLSGAFSQVIFPSPEMDGWQIDYGILKPNSIILYNPMANDVCGNSIPILQVHPSASNYKGHTYGASNSDHPGICDRDLSTAPGIWYKLSVSNFLDYEIYLCNSDFDTQVGLFVGSCGNLICVKGNDDDNGQNGLNVCIIPTASSIGITSVEIESLFPGQLGGEIYIYVTGYGVSLGKFELGINSFLPPCTPNGNIWVGGGSNAWNDASQWSLGHIPLRCENVIIPSGPPITIPSGYTAFASSIYLQGFLLNNGGVLTVSGADQQPGIENDGGNLENHGIIEITDVSGMNSKGLMASPTSTVTNHGTIRTRNVTGIDLHMKSGCNFTNKGVVDIQN